MNDVKVVMACFEWLSQHLPRRIEGNQSR